MYVTLTNQTLPNLTFKATTVTTIQSTTAPLSDITFPSVYICNINQASQKCFYLKFKFILLKCVVQEKLLVVIIVDQCLPDDINWMIKIAGLVEYILGTFYFDRI
jgi:hypothetical protein